MTPSELLKTTNPDLYYTLLDFKDNNHSLFYEVVGKTALSKCNEMELQKALEFYAQKNLKPIL